MSVFLCSIGRLENRYIREYVEHYKSLGFDKIVLYDNNYDGEEDFNDVIGDYIADGFVVLKDYRNKKYCQYDAYNECYAEYGSQCDWIAFFDCDEYLELKKHTTIKEYLDWDFLKGYDMIHLNWMCYGDNGRVRKQNGSIFELFPNPIVPYDLKKRYDFPENNHIKSIVRTCLSNVKFDISRRTDVGPHSMCGVKSCCNAKGVPCEPESFLSPYDLTVAYLRHYVTKSTEEYAEKIKRGFADSGTVSDKGRELMTEMYFKINEFTKEKADFLNSELGTHFMVKRDDVKLYMLCYDKKEYDFTDNSIMTPLQCGAVNGKNVCELKDNTGDNISHANFFYAENTGIYWIYKNVKDAKYKGQTQYRRRLVGIDEDTDFDKIFESHDLICAKPYNYVENREWIPADTVAEGYAYSHCKDDLDILEQVIKSEFSEYSEDYDRCIKNGQNLYYSNGFVMKSEDYDSYCKFLFDVLNRWIFHAKANTYEELILHVSRNVGAGKYKRFEREGRDPMKLTWNEIAWQCKIGGFLSERIFTLWVNHNIPLDRRYEVEYEKMENGMYI